MGKSNAYTGWLLAPADRARLLGEFIPKYPNVIAHHVTYEFGVDDAVAVPPNGFRGTVVGVADDGVGLQALVVEINGTSTAPDGRTFHITWSLDSDAGYKAVMSNTLIEEGWEPVRPIGIALLPFLQDRRGVVHHEVAR